VVIEGKANPNQMMLTRENLLSFQELVKQANKAAKDKNGEAHQPLHILQLTHSGRYSRPYGHKETPLIAQHDPILDARMKIDENTPIVSDGYLDDLQKKYVESAILAKEAGFDGVDIKACHRYLVSELLGGHNREGKYGGSFENRSRFLTETIAAVKKELGNDFIVASRFNVFDAHPFPYGFGCDREDFWQFDESEPLMLIRKMCEAGVDLLSNSAGNPYYIYPQVTRPFDQSSRGIPIPSEHPLESIERLFHFTRLVQKEAGAVPVVGNGYSWLRQFIPYAGAANLKNHSCSFVGLGRSSFAYPQAPYDILHGGAMKPEKCCITCSKCTQIMRDHGMTGCVVKDSEVYVPLFKSAAAEAAAREAGSAGEAIN
jgi:2,4-dienoyl-CoA reductase-like NADH-dependent reductase (Old Yellow Enzyme family)